jgi:two-component system, LytTR family, response regulator
MIKLLIIDDNQDARDLLEAYLRDHTGIEIVGKAINVDEAVQFTVNYKPELVLLDIQMPEKNGFTYLEELKERKLSPGIIFVTAHEDYAIRAIKNAAFDYLLKPVKRGELIAAIDRYSKQMKEARQSDYELLISLLNKSRPERIRLNTRTGYFFIDPADVIFIEASGNYSLIRLATGRTETSSLSLGHLENMIQNKSLIRISRSFIINLNYVSRVDRRSNTCHLEHNSIEYKIKIPLQSIKLLEETS